MAKPHSRKKVEARDIAALDPDEAWVLSLDEKLLGACHPGQRGMVKDPSVRVSGAIGRGGGKTTVARVRALRKVIRKRKHGHPARVGYAATSRPEAERLNWEPMKELLEKLGEMDNFDFAEAKMRCTCRRTGGTYQFFGADDKREVEKQRGQPYDEFQLDETASWNPMLVDWLINRAVGPRLGERNGSILAIGSPGHVLHGLFYEVTRPGSDQHRPYSQRRNFPGWDGWSSHHWNMEQVLALPNARKRYAALALNWDEALRTKEREKWADDNPIWMREYLGLWAADNTTSMYSYQAHRDGDAWNQWSPIGWTATDWDDYFALPFEEQAKKCAWMVQECVKALPAKFTDYLFGYGSDLGSRDPYALNVRAFSPSDPERKLYHVGCFSRRDMFPRLLAELLIGPEATATAMQGRVYTKPGGLYGVTGWPAAHVADLAGLGEMVTGELGSTYGIQVKAAQKKDKFGAIEVVNGDLVDGRMNVLAHSPLEVQYATLQWKPDEYGQPKEDKSARNDHADADTYLRTEIGNMFSAPPPKVDKSEPKREPRKPEPEPERRPRGEFDSLMDDDFAGLL